MMKVAFCGSQIGMTAWQERELANMFTRLVVTEVLCRDYLGSDKLAMDIAIGCGIKNFHIYPINDSKKRAFYFPSTNKRNEWISHPTPNNGTVYYRMEPIKAPLLAADDMIADCSLLIVTPKEFTHTLRSGTWAVVRKAWHVKKEAIIIPPIDRNDEDDENAISDEGIEEG